MPLSYFSRIFPRLQECIRQDVPSALPLNNDSLRRCLDGILSCEPGEKGSLTGDPTFEASFGWEQADISMAALKGKLLDEHLVRCLSNPDRKSVV